MSIDRTRTARPGRTLLGVCPALSYFPDFEFRISFGFRTSDFGPHITSYHLISPKNPPVRRSAEHPPGPNPATQPRTDRRPCPQQRAQSSRPIPFHGSAGSPLDTRPRPPNATSCHLLSPKNHARSHLLSGTGNVACNSLHALGCPATRLLRYSRDNAPSDGPTALRNDTKILPRCYELRSLSPFGEERQKAGASVSDAGPEPIRQP